MLTNLCPASQYPAIWCPQYAAPITLRLARIRLGCPTPVDAPKSVAAAGLDDGMTILPGVETRPKTDVERHGNRQRSWGLLGQPAIDDCHKCRRIPRQDVGIGIDQHRDFITFKR